jgi:SET domain-containing protein
VADSPIHGKELFAKSFIPAGTVIAVVQGRPTRTNGDHVLWIGVNKGYHLQCKLRHINHSDSPNAVYYDSLEVCALRDIQAGEEITHHYGADWKS